MKFLRLSSDASPTQARLLAFAILRRVSNQGAFASFSQDRAIIPNPPSPMQYRREKKSSRPRFLDLAARSPRQALLPSYLTIIVSIQPKPEAQKSGDGRQPKTGVKSAMVGEPRARHRGQREITGGKWEITGGNFVFTGGNLPEVPYQSAH